MPIQILDQIFMGPYEDKDSLPNRPGIYVILCQDGNSGSIVLDVGESSDIKNRIKNHDREKQWLRCCYNVRYCCLPILDEEVRKELEQKIRLSYNPICGERKK